MAPRPRRLPGPRRDRARDAPVVVLPTPVGLGNVLAPAITPIALGSVPPGVVVASVAVAVAVVGWVVLGGWLAAALEAEGARIVARDPDLADAGRMPRMS